MNKPCLYVNIFSVEICGKSLGGVIQQVFRNPVGLFNLLDLLDIRTRRLLLISIHGCDLCAYFLAPYCQVLSSQIALTKFPIWLDKAIMRILRAMRVTN